jgi:hypothetical protein
VFSVSSPAEKLETLFLRIVEEAQAANIATSGARAAGATPDFLGAGDSAERVIRELIAAADAPPATGTVEPIPTESAEVGPAGEVIEELVSEASRPAATLAPEPLPDVPALRQAPVEADRGVIDSLLSDRKGPQSRE